MAIRPICRGVLFATANLPKARHTPKKEVVEEIRSQQSAVGAYCNTPLQRKGGDIKMELTVGELREARTALIKIATTDQPFKLAYRLKKIGKIVDKEAQEIEEVRVEKVRKYGKSDPDVGFRVTPENNEIFQKEMEEINNTKITLDIQPIPLELLEGVRLSPLEVMRLEKFIEEPALHQNDAGPVGAGLAPAQQDK